MMKRFLLVSAMAALVVVGACRRASAQSVTIEMVTVGDAGNAADTRYAAPGYPGYGAVDYKFQIGKYEVTTAQYCAFLNAAAKADPYLYDRGTPSHERSGSPTGKTESDRLYHGRTGYDVRGQITRSGDPGSYSYSVRTGDGYTMADKAMNFVSWYNAVRFCNWLHNGQPSDGSGLQSGAYTLVGRGGNPTNAATITRNEGAKFWLPSPDEWYKAAHYDPNKGGPGVRGYWNYATKSHEAPKSTHADASGNGDGYWNTGTSGDWTAWVSGATGNVANYNNGADWNGQDGMVTTVGTNGGPSPYGAFDMAGNVREWSEAVDARNCLVETGMFAGPGRTGYAPTYADFNLGFRVAGAIAVPSASADGRPTFRFPPHPDSLPLTEEAPEEGALPISPPSETPEKSGPLRSRILYLPPERSITESEEFRRDWTRIYGLRKPPVPGQPVDLGPYEKAARDVERTWSRRDGESYFNLMLELCASLVHGNQGTPLRPSPDDPRLELARKYALAVLEARDEIPLSLELRAANFIYTDTLKPNAPRGEDFARLRREDARVSLHAWKRLIDAVDPNSTMDYAALSAEYEAAIRRDQGRPEYEATSRRIHEEQLKQLRLEEHLFMRDRLYHFPIRVQSDLIRAYSKAPFDLAELSQYLDEYIPDGNTTKTRILSVVRRKIDKGE